MHNKSEHLIQVIKEKGFLTSGMVEDAIRKTPRHFFVPEEHLDEAYEDKAIETKNLQTISQPSVVARMTEWLDVKPGIKVLEIGTGSGWQSAIIAKLVDPEKVYSIERCLELVGFAKNNHKKAHVKNVEIIHGDGTLGLSEKASFDRIIITAACKKIPNHLVEQLADNRLLIAPVGGYPQSLILFKKISQGIIEIKNQPGYAFVPLFGKFDNQEN